MSTVLPTSEWEARTSDISQSTPFSSSQPSKPQRVLACVRCQQRKIKCDRRFPCANCNTSHAQCVPATLAPRGRRRRRLPERELLERLRKYEDLLHQNNVKFEPLHKDPAEEKKSTNTQGGDESDGEQPEASGADWSFHSTAAKPERVYEAKSFWHALNLGVQASGSDSDSSHDEVLEVVVKKGWVQLFGENDHLLFGSRIKNVDLSTLHPSPVQIFRLWQIYLDNVNPLLKVTHTPSLQGHIIEAASNVTNIKPTLEALMFSIYCMAILSLAVDDCQAIFGSSKDDLLIQFQFSCQQALLNCGFLRSSDRDCLTAFYLYLVSVRPSTVPQSLSAMLGVAIRIAQRMGIHSESALAKCTALEAELRRRLWWSLVLFDTRISEMADHKTATLAPTWDCRIPLNVNDSDLRPEMKVLPAVQEKSTDALFAVVRSELGEFVRHTMFHLAFTSPALKPIFKTALNGLIQEADELTTLEKTIEDKYLKFCDPENPLHFIAIWWTRAYLAKCRLLEHHSRYSNSSVQQTDAQCDAAISHALRMLECDTQFRTSPLIKRFLWLAHLYFPFPAYIQIIQDLKRRPGSEHAEQAWEVMSDNYEARFGFLCKDSESPLFKIFTKIVLQGWGAREAALSQLGEPLMPPRIVSSIRQRVAQIAQNAQTPDTHHPHVMGIGIDNFPMSIPIASIGSGGQGGYGAIRPGEYPNALGQAPIDVDVGSLDWAAMDSSFRGMYPGVWDAEL
ncbi:uncharacterized protein BDR25DRAFT_269406 [Lindgomyces ingoldianus]|uniref:Uncharacterized protein n=1 Tax=Lindgomyces ingoldianus TaxID=673940 RepID=A0ACB6QJA1_9PLEO|nr:uncharacterized protein BDR25DRAFT_269406 [Lindgomyces ingoldianus]KAF2466207.1 hypothetical protein BDR25DRAFT_269406 [Lindgomyces ingoldianus]